MCECVCVCVDEHVLFVSLIQHAHIHSVLSLSLELFMCLICTQSGQIAAAQEMRLVSLQSAQQDLSGNVQKIFHELNSHDSQVNSKGVLSSFCFRLYSCSEC